MKSRLLIVFMFVISVLSGNAQIVNDKPGHVNPEDMQVDMNNPTFVPMVKVGKVLMGGYRDWETDRKSVV